MVLASEQEVKEDKETLSIVSDVQETLTEDAVFSVVAKEAKRKEPLSGVERHTLIASFVRDLMEHLVFAFSACGFEMEKTNRCTFHGDRPDQVR